MYPNIAGWLDNLMSMISKKSYKVEYNSKNVDEENIVGYIDVLFF